MDLDDLKLPVIVCSILIFVINIVLSYILLSFGNMLPTAVVSNDILVLFNLHSDLKYRLYVVTYESIFGVTYGNTVLSSMSWGGAAFFGAMLSRSGKDGVMSGAISVLIGMVVTFLIYVLIQIGDIMEIIQPTSMIILTMLSNRILWPLIFASIAGGIGGLVTREHDGWH